MAIIDCDIHVRFDDETELTQYLPRRYQDRGFQFPGGVYVNPTGFNRVDAIPEDGGEPAASPENVQRNLLDEHDITAGIISGNTRALGLSVNPDRDYALELARAHNEWVLNDWLPADDRLFGSVVVAPQTPEKSADLIEDYGSNPEFVQVVMGSTCNDPYGNSRYWPIYEAAEEQGLPIALHASNFGAGMSAEASAAGTPSTYFEWHTAASQHYMGQLSSMIIEGVFEEFDDLSAVFIEGGFGWVPHLMWRLNKNWKSLRNDAPWLKKSPSEYIRDQVRFTTQPVEEPEKPEHLVQIFEMMHAEETLMFSSDYPHWDADDPTHAFPKLPENLEQRILMGNAVDLYPLPETRVHGSHN